jgi:hypothetical protein
MDILGEQAAREAEARDWRPKHPSKGLPANAFRKPDEIPRQLPGVVPQPVDDDACCDACSLD